MTDVAPAHDGCAQCGAALTSHTRRARFATGTLSLVGGTTLAPRAHRTHTRARYAFYSRRRRDGTGVRVARATSLVGCSRARSPFRARHVAARPARRHLHAIRAYCDCTHITVPLTRTHTKHTSIQARERQCSPCLTPAPRPSTPRLRSLTPLRRYTSQPTKSSGLCHERSFVSRFR